GFQYIDHTLQFFPTAEGYVSVTDGKFKYVYNYTDHLGNIRLSYSRPELTSPLVIMEESHYYPFGMKHSNYAGEKYEYVRGPGGDGFVILEAVERNKYQYKYNGKEFQDELSLNWYDYGARNYDPAIGRWMNMDPMAGKWDSYSPYNYTLNSPLFFVDPNGEDVYLFYYVKSDNKEDNSMFWNSLLTHAKELLNSGEFGEGDIGVYREISDLGQLEGDVEKTVAKYSGKYGQTKEFGIWSHAGLDGPIGSRPASKNALYNEGDNLGNGRVASSTSSQLSVSGWSSINFNWKDDGTSNAYFYGCNTGKDPDGKGLKKSFTTTLSSLGNFKNVDVGGQPNSSYPSMYANIRETNSAMRSGNFAKQATYMVAAGPLGVAGRWQPNYAYPMNISRNGETITPHYQIGTNK
ncbi:RHS repeat-associated protein, partial [Flavobacterium arsenatis]